jgi:hypothetical protein
MIVAFRNGWWNGLEGKHYDKTSVGVEVPDEYRSILPSSAKILSAEDVETAKKAQKKGKVKEPNTLSELSKTLPDPIEIAEGKA